MDQPGHLSIRIQPGRTRLEFKRHREPIIGRRVAEVISKDSHSVPLLDWDAESADDGGEARNAVAARDHAEVAKAAVGSKQLECFFEAALKRRAHRGRVGVLGQD